MSQAPFSRALNRWQEILPDTGILQGDGAAAFLDSREGYRRQVPCVLRPISVEQVQGILRIANESAQPVYPVSTGRNWGMGSALPVEDGCVIIDLSGLNTIRELCPDKLFAMIEPGVTQGQLYDEIQKQDLPLLLNVTGSACDTSLIGNALARGVGYFQHRVHELAGMEVVLANGELLRTGFAAWPEAATASIYQQGLGPDLGALFAQSNFGVVTAAGFRLLPRPEKQAVVLLSSRKGVDLASFLEACIGLRRRNILQHILHVANGERSRITVEPLLFDEWKADEPSVADAELLSRMRAWLDKQPSSRWNAVCGLSGDTAQVDSALKNIRKRMHPWAAVRSFTPTSLQRITQQLNRFKRIPGLTEKHRFLRAVSPLLSLGFGIPTDAPQRALDWPSDGSVSGGGVLYTLPLYPATCADALPALQRLEALGEQRGFAVSATLNVVDAHCMEGVVSISFDRTHPEEAQKARDCITAMEALSIQDGFPPYRTGIGRMHLAHPHDPVRNGIIHGLKTVFDPQGILAPGRYQPPAQQP